MNIIGNVYLYRARTYRVKLVYSQTVMITKVPIHGINIPTVLMIQERLVVNAEEVELVEFVDVIIILLTASSVESIDWTFAFFS